MLTLLEFSKQIANLKKEKKYSEAISYFEKNKNEFTKEQIANNEYIVSDILTCLRQLNNLDEGFQFLNTYGIEIKEGQKERILSAYGWLLWALYKAKNDKKIISSTEDDFTEVKYEKNEVEDLDFKKSELIEKIETLITILNQLESDFTKTLLSNLFMIVLKTEKKKAIPNWKVINEFCNKINLEKLSKECSIIKVEQKGQLKDMELASDFENWYAFKTKALEKLCKWEECFNLSKEALEKIKKFHHSNDVWFLRRIALSKKNLGNTEDAIKELQSILKKKHEWFIKKELAELYFEKGDVDLALKEAIDAIKNSKKLEYKVDLLYLLGKILSEKKQLELSFKHFSLSKLIRQSEKWKVPQKLLEELRKFTFPEIQKSDFEKLKNELQKYWQSYEVFPIYNDDKHIESSNIDIKGEVVKILHDNERGKDGFIKYNGREYYFSVFPDFHSISKIAVGTKVFFEIKQAADGKRKKAKIKKVID